MYLTVEIKAMHNYAPRKLKFFLIVLPDIYNFN